MVRQMKAFRINHFFSVAKKIYQREAFSPTFFLGIWINPHFITRRGLLKGIKIISSSFKGGLLLDVGCGSKPYEHMFQVDQYIGIDVENSGHCHSSSRIDRFFDGRHIEYPHCHFDYVFSSQVFEHVFDIYQLLGEINRVLKINGELGFTCPFAWEVHEHPYDFWRYTPFGIKDLLLAHGFELKHFARSTGYVETILQMLSTYVSQHALPKNKYLNLIFQICIIAPINILGIILGKLLPRSNNLYCDNIVIAKKIRDIELKQV